VSSDDAQEAFEALPSGLDDLVRKPIRKDLAWERGDVHASRLVLEDITERLKVRITPAHKRVAELECRDVRLAHDLVVCIHLTAESMGLGVPHLYF